MYRSSASSGVHDQLDGIIADERRIDGRWREEVNLSLEVDFDWSQSRKNLLNVESNATRRQFRRQSDPSDSRGHGGGAERDLTSQLRPAGDGLSHFQK